MPRATSRFTVYETREEPGLIHQQAMFVGPYSLTGTPRLQLQLAGPESHVAPRPRSLSGATAVGTTFSDTPGQFDIQPGQRPLLRRLESPHSACAAGHEPRAGLSVEPVIFWKRRYAAEGWAGWRTVGLYLSPPDKAVVACVDEKPQAQALERTAPCCRSGPASPKRTHDCIHTAPPRCSPPWRSPLARSPTPATPAAATRGPVQRRRVARLGMADAYGVCLGLAKCPEWPDLSACGDDDCQVDSWSSPSDGQE
jgi:hypothetical protein